METFVQLLESKINQPIKIFLEGGLRFDCKIKSVDGVWIKAVETTADKDKNFDRVFNIDRIVAIIF